ncbi:MAG: hypothetical protein FWC27_06185 [Firmicutes bacterium]|nr:hypothetical protein [Bacillota bacterium]
MNKSAAELHRDSPAYGREGGFGTMPVYRNPIFGEQKLMDEAAAREIAEKFGQAMGKTYVYAPPYWMAPGEQERIREQVGEKLRATGDSEEEIEKVLREQFFTQESWEFRCGDESLTVNAWGGISLTVPLPDLPPIRITDRAKYESVCLQIYQSYAAGYEAVTGLRFNNASTAFDYNIYGEEMFQTFFYVNNSADPLAKQAEDYALRRLDVNIPFASMAEEPDEVLVAYLHYDGSHSGAAELGGYPVMDLAGAKQALLDSHYEASVSATPEELSRATVEEAELIYADRPWLSAWMPVYRLSLTFPQEDMGDWNNNTPS